MEININGVQYELIPKEPIKSSSKMSGYMAAMLGIYGNMFSVNQPKPKSFPDVNLVEEFKLIQAKKSNLSRSEREMVVRKFNRIFRIKTDE